MGWSELVDKLRENFEKKYGENISKGLYDERDVDRIRNDFRFTRSFIRGMDRLEEGADLIHTALVFKKEYKVHDVTEEMFSIEMRELGALFFRAKDVNGSRILWLKVQLHRKDASADYIRMEKLGVASSLEKALFEDPNKPIVVVLDMSNCGLVNMDIDFVKFIITCFKFHYPTFLEYMLIYDMPWIFNAAWRIVKAWLSAEASGKIKFVTKSTVQTYIAPANLPVHMGGTDDFKFVYTPGMSLEPLYPEDEKQDEKKVTFEAPESDVSEAPTVTANGASVSTQRDSQKTTGLLTRTNNNSITRTAPSSNADLRNRRTSSSNNINNNSNDKMNQQMRPKSHSNNIFVGRFLSISPADQLSFAIDKAGDAYDIITLSNTLSVPVAFKVKTTSPEKYRVRPSSGIVQPNKTEEVFVYLTEEHKKSAMTKDKFLIMALEVTGPVPEDSGKLWKDVHKDSIMEHRLKCAATTTYVFEENAKIEKEIVSPESSLDEKLSRLERHNLHLQRQMYLLIILQITAAIFFLLVLFSYSCFGEDLFTRFLAPPFGFCSDSYGRKC